MAAAIAGKHAPGSTLTYHDVDGEKEWFEKYGNNGYGYGPSEYKVYISRAIPSNHKYIAIEVGEESAIIGKSQGRGSLNWSLK